MPRSNALRALSSDHHHALMAVRSIRLLAKGSRDLLGTVDELKMRWRTEIEAHFDREERWLLPALVRAVGENDPRVRRTLEDHRELRRAFESLGPQIGIDELNELAERLASHVRFEERELFPAVEAELSPEELGRLGEALGNEERLGGEN